MPLCLASSKLVPGTVGSKQLLHQLHEVVRFCRLIIRQLHGARHSLLNANWIHHSTNQSINRLSNPLTNRFIHRPKKNIVDQSIHRPINPQTTVSTNHRPVDRSIRRPINHLLINSSTNQYIDQSTLRPTRRPINSPTNQPIDQPTRRPMTLRPINMSTNQPSTDKSVD